MDSRNLALAVLTVTAAILFVGLVVVSTLSPQQAMAVGQMDRAGDYVVATGQLQDSTEVVYIADAAEGRLNVYVYDLNRRQLQMLDAFDLKSQLRGPRP